MMMSQLVFDPPADFLSRANDTAIQVTTPRNFTAAQTVEAFRRVNQLRGDYTRYQMQQMVFASKGDPDFREITQRPRSQIGGGTGAIAEFLPPYDPSRVGMSTRKKMMDSPEVKLGLKAITAPIQNAFEAVVMRSEDQRQAGFAKAVIDPLKGSFVRSGLMALPWGFQPHEKVLGRRNVSYEYGDGINRKTEVIKNAIVYEQIKELDPQLVTVKVFRKDGAFAGVEFDDGRTDKRLVPADRCWLVVHEGLYGNLIGKSVLDPVYEPWYKGKAIELYTLRYLERSASPPLVGRAPMLYTSQADSTTATGLQFMLEALEKLIGEGILVLPADVNSKGDWVWDVKYLMDDQRAPMYLEALRHWQEQIFRAMGIPERVLTQYGSVGTYAMAKAHTDTFIGTLTSILNELLLYINAYLLPQLVTWNFSDPAPVTMETVVKLGDRKELILQLVSEIIAAESRVGSTDAGKLANIAEALQQLNFPTATPDQLRAKNDQEQARIQAQQALKAKAEENAGPETMDKLRQLEHISGSQWMAWQDALSMAKAQGWSIGSLPIPMRKTYQKSVYDVMSRMCGTGKRTASLAREVARIRDESLRKYAEAA